jgi:hypothetical protein
VGADYQAASGTLTFTPGTLSRTFTVTINGDRVAEANETFQVVLSGPSGATISAGTATVTITDDDKAMVAEQTAGPDTAAVASLTLPELDQVVKQAKAIWLASDPSADLNTLTVSIADLDDTILGLTSGSSVTIDVTAAGYGWFIDSTPYESSEYRMRGDSLVAKRNSEAYERMDLLTVVMHELGHVLGYDHQDRTLLSPSLAAGERQLESAARPDSRMIDWDVTKPTGLIPTGWTDEWMKRGRDKNFPEIAYAEFDVEHSGNREFLPRGHVEWRIEM